MKKYVWLLLALLLCTLTLSASADAPTIEFSVQSGFYNFAQQLKITCSDKKATIYYTTDGSVPDETDRKYTRPVYMSWSNDHEASLMKRTGTNAAGDFIPTADFPTAHVIRAVAINRKGERSEVVNGTFFINVNRQENYGDTPVLCLVADPEDLYDHERGIFVTGKVYEEWAAAQTGEYKARLAPANYTQTGPEWQRNVHVTWMPAEGKGFSREMLLAVEQGSSGASSQKPLRISVPEDGAPLEQDGRAYRSFILSHGDSDCDYARIREPLALRLAKGIEVSAAAGRSCIVFLNGEYWGLYSLEEDLDEEWLEARYAEKDAAIVGNPALWENAEADWALYTLMHDYILQHDMASPEIWNAACGMLDMASFADYCAVQLYILNNEGSLAAGPWRMWRSRQEDGKWRMLLGDLSQSADRHGEAMAAGVDNITPALQNGAAEVYDAALLLPALMKNEDFAAMFLRACCDVRSLYFSQERVTEQFTVLADQYRPYMTDTIRRFGPEWAQWGPAKSYRLELDELRAFYRDRHACFVPILQTAMGLNPACTVTVQTSDPEMGSVYLNGRSVAVQEGASCLYFSEGGLSAKAVPASGAKFIGWTISGDGVLSDANALSTQISFTGSITLTANFE